MEFTGEKFESFFNHENQDCRWSHFRHMEGGEMLEHMQTRVFPFLKSLDGEKSPLPNT